MKSTILCLASIAQIVLLSVSAEPIQKIPLYYKRHNKQDFIASAAEGLENGMLGGIVQIGNPPQNLTMAFDTSTGFSWVRGTQCISENCLGRKDFNAENSTSAVSTYHNFTLNYGKGVVNTTIYVDTFRYAGLTVEKMPFGSAYEMKDFNKGFDGYLGLGRDVNLNSSTTFYAKRGTPPASFVPNAFQLTTGMQSAQFGIYTTKSTPGQFSQSGSVPGSDAVSNDASSNDAASNGAASSDASSNDASSNGAASNSASTNGASSNSATSNDASSNSATSNGASSNSASSDNTASNVPASNVPASNGASNTVSTGSVTPGGWGIIKRNHDQDEPAGYLVLGGIDKDAIKGELYHMNVAQEDNDSGSWAVRVNEAKFDDLQFHVNKKAKAVLSTSTDVIGLPNEQAEQFRKQWYAEYDKPDNTFKIPCCLMNKFSSFTIQLDKTKAVIPPRYWSYPRKADNCCDMCRTHIGKSGSDKDYVIGYSFTNAFYTSYDISKDIISLGLKKNHVNDGLQLYNV